MSAERRDGRHQNGFAQLIRSDQHGGSIPAEWSCNVIDLDELYAVLGDTALQIRTDGRVWVWWSGPPFVPVALAERKTVADEQMSWAVTEALARACDLEGFRIVGGWPDGHVEVTDLGYQATSYDSVRMFIGERIRPLIAASKVRGIGEVE